MKANMIMGMLATFIVGNVAYSMDVQMNESLEPLPPYDWSSKFEVSPQQPHEKGNQVLHSKSTNKPYTKNPEAREFVQRCLINGQQEISDADVLRNGITSAAIQGAYIEAGVGMGRTINFMAALKPMNTIYGFDSFEGLPEGWDKGDRVIPKGTFACKDPNYVPPLLSNVTVYKGLFSEVLPKFRESVLKETPIAFLHIDCDIYSSTKDVFTALGKNIKPGTVIVFDEFYNYPNYAEHEGKAFSEFLMDAGYSWECLCYNINHEQVAVRITY